MKRLQPARGDSKLGCLMWLVLVGFGAYVALQIIPAKMKAAELEKFMTLQAEQSASFPVETIRAKLLARIEEMGLPVDKKAVHVQRVGGRIRVEYSYSMPINLLVTKYEMPFDIKVDRPFFML